MAGSDINVGMGVTGVSQFKSAMSQASASVKTLDAALKLNEKQFKASGDAETYMAQQASLLKSQISAQQVVVKNAEKALEQMTKNGTDKASVAYQKMQQQALKAQETLLDMQTALDGVESGTGGAASGLEKLGNEVSNVSKRADFSAVISGLQSITNVVEKAAAKIRDLAVGAWGELMDVAGNADDTLTNATILGLSVEDYQRMVYAAEAMDTSADTIVKARKKMDYNIGTKNKGAMEAFAALGVDIYNRDPNASAWDKMFGKDITGAKEWEDILWSTGEALQKVSTEEADVYAQQIFGKSWSDLSPMFANGREAYEAAMAEASTNSQKSLEDLANLNDTVNELKLNFQTLETETLAAFAPTLTTIADSLSGFFKDLTEYLKTDEGKKSLEGISQAMEDLFGNLSNVDFSVAMENVKGAIEKFKDGLVWISENKKTIIDTITGIAKAFAGLKIAEGVLTFMNLLSGAKGLLTGGGDLSAAGAAAGSSWGSGFAGAVMKAAPWLAFLSTLLTPSTAGGDALDGEINAQYQEESRLAMETNIAKTKWYQSSGYGENVITDKLYNGMQELWDLYRTGQDHQTQFNEMYKIAPLQMFADMESLDKSMEDLPDGFFKLPAKPDFDLEAVQEELNEAGLTVDVGVRFKFPEAGGAEYDGNGLTRRHHHASGLNYVPYNGYPAILHKGERVMTRWENEAYMGGGYSINDLTSAVTYALGSVGIYMGSDQVGNLTTNRVSNNIAKRSNARLRSMGG